MKSNNESASDVYRLYFLNLKSKSKRLQTPMEENYTSNALVQFVYREMPADQAVEMAHQIDEDPELRSMFDDLLLAKIQLPKARFNPSNNVLNNILQYSTKTALEASL